NDTRFDRNFPSKVLLFLYSGNLAHASNIYMLRALGITHVVAVGECALVPPDHLSARGHHGAYSHFVASTTNDPHSRSPRTRIKFLDIQGICDDEIDTLKPQIGAYMSVDRRRAEGGQVCGAGVSRSAAVIAYVMKHLSLPLIDTYWERVRARRVADRATSAERELTIKCAGEEREQAVVGKNEEEAAGEEEMLKRELSSALSWPYLAKDVHRLNESIRGEVRCGGELDWVRPDPFVPVRLCLFDLFFSLSMYVASRYSYFLFPFPLSPVVSSMSRSRQIKCTVHAFHDIYIQYNFCAINNVSFFSMSLASSRFMIFATSSLYVV
ncbi:hypothetical protein BT96DRAFT_833388, partial [Gymnopus androsaceus JB14]